MIEPELLIVFCQRLQKGICICFQILCRAALRKSVTRLRSLDPLHVCGLSLAAHELLDALQIIPRLHFPAVY